MLFLLALKWNVNEKAFSYVKASYVKAKMLKEATIHFFLIDESQFSNICTL